MSNSPRSGDLVADGLLTVPEAAKFLSVCRATVYNLMDRGELSYCKLGRARRIPRQALVDLARRNLVGPDAAQYTLAV